MKKKILIILAVIILFIGAFLVFIYFNKNNKSKIFNNSICHSIETYKKEKKSFIIFINKNDSTELDSIAKDYNDADMNNKCINNELNETSLTDMANSNPVAIVYKDGLYVGAFINPEDDKQFIDYLDSKDVIKKKKIKETTNLDDFRNKLSQEYILVLISDEEQREWVDKNTK